MKYSSFPEILRKQKQWILWRLEKTKEGRETKVPYSTKGYKAASTGEQDWSSFDEVIDTLIEKRELPYQGIGYVFVKEVVGIDLDNCFEGKELKPWAKIIYEKFDTYAEISPSGKGLHLIGSASIDFKGHKRDRLNSKGEKEGVECYVNGRYFTVTGDVYEGRNTIKKIDVPTLEAWLEATFPEKTNSIPSPLTGKTLPDDETILARIRKSKNGAKFQTLFDLGNFASLGFGSQSEADLSTAGALMFWCCNNTTVADRLFRRSKLFRPKWDEKHGAETYGQLTLKKAVRNETVNWFDPTSDDPSDLLKTIRLAGQVTIEKTGLGYKATTPVEKGKVVVEFSEIYISRQSIEVIVKIFLDFVVGGESTPYEQRIDLRSASAQSSLVTALNKAYGNEKEGYNWTLIINRIFSGLTTRLKSEQTSESLVGMRYEEPEFLIYPFLQKNAPALVYGQPEAGKSFLCTRLAVSLATGLPFLGTNSPSNIKTLYIDYEDEKQPFVSRLHKICAGLNIEYDNVAPFIEHYHPSGSVKDTIDIIRQIVETKNMSLVIFDAGGDAAGGSPNDEQKVIDLFNAMHTLNCTKLIIHHEPKSTLGVTDENAYYGTMYWRGRARTGWRLSVAVAEQGGNIVKMVHTKHSNSPQTAPLFYRISYETAADAEFADRKIPMVVFQKVDEPKDETESNSILDAIGYEGASMAQIQEITTLRRSSAQREILALEKEKKIERKKKGKGFIYVRKI